MSCVKIFLADLLGNQYLFEIPLISFTVKVSDNVVKREFCISFCDGEHEGAVQSILCNKVSKVFKSGTNRIVFYIFEYSAEYVAECSADVKLISLHNLMRKNIPLICLNV